MIHRRKPKSRRRCVCVCVVCKNALPCKPTAKQYMRHIAKHHTKKVYAR